MIEPESSATSLENNIAIMREIRKILFWEKMRKIMPLITRELVKAGVDFSRATIPSDGELETAIDAAMSEEYF